MSNRNLTLAAMLTFISLLLCAQEQMRQPDISQMNPADHTMSSMSAATGDGTAGMGNESAEVIHSMQAHHLEMGPHMKMTTVRDLKPGDQQRADLVVEAARKVAERYLDYRNALADGFRIFQPDVPQNVYHFTKYAYALEAISHFNPDRPSSLLYEKNAEGYKLVGVMYTASKDATEEDLDARIPLSIAQWHAHINLCVPPSGEKEKAPGEHPQFGFNGSINSQQGCAAARGKFFPQVFGWMVHVYPFATKPTDIWSVDRQKHMD